MHPLVKGAAAVAVLTALGGLDDRVDAPPPATAAAAPGVDGLPVPCGAGTLPEGSLCLRIPVPNELPR